MPFREIAEKLGCAEDTARHRYDKVVCRRLRATLKARGVEFDDISPGGAATLWDAQTGKARGVESDDISPHS